MQRSYFGTIKIGVDPDGVKGVEFDVGSVEGVGDVDVDVGCVEGVGDVDVDVGCVEGVGDVVFDVGCIEGVGDVDFDDDCVEGVGDVDCDVGCVEGVGDVDVGEVFVEGAEDGFVFGVTKDVDGVDFDFAVIVVLCDVGVVDGFVGFVWSVSYFRHLINLIHITLKMTLL